MPGKLTSRFPQRACKQGLVLLTGWQLDCNLQEMNIFRSSLWQFGPSIWQFRRCENVTEQRGRVHTVWLHKSDLLTKGSSKHTRSIVPFLGKRTKMDGLPQAATCAGWDPVAENACSPSILVAHICSAPPWFCASKLSPHLTELMRTLPAFPCPSVLPPLSYYNFWPACGHSQLCH